MLKMAWQNIQYIIGLTITLITLFTYFSAEEKGWGLTIIFLLLCGILTHNIYMIIVWGRQRKFSRIVNYIADGFANVHCLRRRKYDIEITRQSLNRLCSDIASAFKILTKKQCNASIKVLIYDTENGSQNNSVTDLKVVTFARNHNIRRSPRENSVNHWLHLNSDFLEIFESASTDNGITEFYCNSLPTKLNYKTTSFQSYQVEPPSSTYRLKRIFQWKLRYKSTIVVPIIPDDQEQTGYLVGFLCIDCVNRYAFRKSTDIDLLKGIADGIYNTVEEIYKNLNKQEV